MCAGRQSNACEASKVDSIERLPAIKGEVMTYATLMVHVQLGRSNGAVLKVTRELAERHRSNVVGIAAVRPAPVLDGGLSSADVYQMNLDEINQELRNSESEFRRVLEGSVKDLEWRSASVFSSLADHIAREARSADLILTGGRWQRHSGQCASGEYR